MGRRKALTIAVLVAVSVAAGLFTANAVRQRPSSSGRTPGVAAPSVTASVSVSPSVVAPVAPTVSVPSGGSGRPTSPPAVICGSAAQLSGPATAPVGAVVVPAGDNSGWTESWNSSTFAAAGKTFWFAPGVHTLGSGQYAQIAPGANTRFVGAPGAILDGQHKNLYAFTQTAANVTIEYLTIRNFGTGTSNNDEGVVNHDRGAGWVVAHNLITGNDGAGVMLGPDSKTSYNCLKDNGQYGFSSLAPQGAAADSNVVLDHNEITGNNTDDWERLRAGCGCTGGGKFWETSGAVVTDNYVHHNRGAGLWADNNNRGFLFERNWIEGNDAEGIEYEVSFNFMIRNNVFVRNALVTGKTEFGGVGNSFPMAAIYISEAGGDSRAGSLYSTSGIIGNYFEDNWDGVALWENADRFCRPGENSVNAVCPFFTSTWGTRFKTQNIQVSGNEFRFTKANTGCTNAYCGRNAVFSNYGTDPYNSPYMGTVIQQAITFNQNNVWSANRYVGPWHFLPYDTGTDRTFTQWQASPYHQDAGSTYN